MILNVYGGLQKYCQCIFINLFHFSCRGVQWNSPKNQAKVGGPTGWSPQPMAATTGANYRPMVSLYN